MKYITWTRLDGVSYARIVGEKDKHYSVEKGVEKRPVLFPKRFTHRELSKDEVVKLRLRGEL